VPPTAKLSIVAALIPLANRLKRCLIVAYSIDFCLRVVFPLLLYDSSNLRIVFAYLFNFDSGTVSPLPKYAPMLVYLALLK
jgi:hypothetical protein